MRSPAPPPPDLDVADLESMDPGVVRRIVNALREEPLAEVARRYHLTPSLAREIARRAGL